MTKAKKISITDEVPVPNGINIGLRNIRNRDAIKYLGYSRDEYFCHRPGTGPRSYCKNDPNGRYCPPANVQAFKNRVKLRNVGPFRVSGFDLAVESLKDIMKEIKREEREVYNALQSDGMLCCRRISGSKSISNHAWGMALDLKINGVRDDINDGNALYGITLIAPIFHKHGWYWGAGFSKEDSMHFEISREKLNQWGKDGLLIYDGSEQQRESNTAIASLSPDSSSMYNLTDAQDMLNTVLGTDIKTDGRYSPDTRAAIITFQHDAGQENISGNLSEEDWNLLIQLTKRGKI